MASKIGTKRIAYVTGTRADFGLMVPVLRAIQNSKKLRLLLYATGIHLMPQFGETIADVRRNFNNVKIIPAAFGADNRESVAKFTGEALPKIIAAFIKDKPDFVLTLGDRPEMLCVVLACLYLGIPTGQIHGGEKTHTVDELARHAITKLSQVHFAATSAAAKRIENMGEEKWRVHMVGTPALDVVLNEKLPTRVELCRLLRLDPVENIILVTQHPTSENWQSAGQEMQETLAAVKGFNMQTVAVYPHADAGGRRIIKEIERERKNPNFRIFASLPHKVFLALEREAAVWVGNSSAAMIESASFGTPVVNVGLRQLGREHGENVIDVACERDKIASAIREAVSAKREMRTQNLYGDGKTAPRIVKILDNLEIDQKLMSKQLTY